MVRPDFYAVCKVSQMSSCAKHHNYFEILDNLKNNELILAGQISIWQTKYYTFKKFRPIMKSQRGKQKPDARRKVVDMNERAQPPASISAEDRRINRRLKSGS